MIEDLTERIQEVMKEYSYTPSVFADEIGVQRPAISHILSGRNRPSLDIVLKIIKKFPKINSHWLLTGEGNMIQLNLFGESAKIESSRIDKIDPPSPPAFFPVSDTIEHIENQSVTNHSALELNKTIQAVSDSATGKSQANENRSDNPAQNPIDLNIRSSAQASLSPSLIPDTNNPIMHGKTQENMDGSFPRTDAREVLDQHIDNKYINHISNNNIPEQEAFQKTNNSDYQDINNVNRFPGTGQPAQYSDGSNIPPLSRNQILSEPGYQDPAKAKREWNTDPENRYLTENHIFNNNNTHNERNFQGINEYNPNSDFRNSNNPGTDQHFAPSSDSRNSPPMSRQQNWPESGYSDPAMDSREWNNEPNKTHSIENKHFNYEKSRYELHNQDINNSSRTNPESRSSINPGTSHQFPPYSDGNPIPPNSRQQNEQRYTDQARATRERNIGPENNYSTENKQVNSEKTINERINQDINSDFHYYGDYRRPYNADYRQPFNPNEPNHPGYYPNHPGFHPDHRRYHTDNQNYNNYNPANHPQYPYYGGYHPDHGFYNGNNQRYENQRLHSGYGPGNYYQNPASRSNPAWDDYQYGNQNQYDRINPDSRRQNSDYKYDNYNSPRNNYREAMPHQFAASPIPGNYDGNYYRENNFRTGPSGYEQANNLRQPGYWPVDLNQPQASRPTNGFDPYISQNTNNQQHNNKNYPFTGPQTPVNQENFNANQGHLWPDKTESGNFERPVQAGFTQNNAERSATEVNPGNVNQEPSQKIKVSEVAGRPISPIGKDVTETMAENFTRNADKSEVPVSTTASKPVQAEANTRIPTDYEFLNMAQSLIDSQKTEKKVEKIIIFYSDKTFGLYNQE